jgi:ribonuclease-3
MNKIKVLLKKLNIKYENINYYVEAFSHLSYTNEHKSKNLSSYERLEFLGDAVLQKVSSEYLFRHSSRDPGEMTLIRSKLVRKESLAKIARELKLDKYILLGKGTLKETLSDSILEDVLEALIGAIELDLGHVASITFINNNIS